MTYRLADSLVQLRKQINEAYPNRNKASDGWIGDDAHRAQGKDSDHNPWIRDGNGVGVVTALDITHDPENGIDIDKFSDLLAERRDPRIKYIIANGLIAGPFNGWQWQPNSGHYSHIHVSVNTDNYDDESDWDIGKKEDEVLENFEDVNELYVSALHRELNQEEKDKELWKGYVGKSWKQALSEVRKSTEWLEKNHIVAIAHKETVEQVEKLQKQLEEGEKLDALEVLKQIKELLESRNK